MDNLKLSIDLTKVSQPPSRKRVRSSKNKKKGWRKHSNIDDIEEHLEDQRLQERTGGLVSEKTNEELFFIERQVEKEEEDVPAKKPRKLLHIEKAFLPDPKIKPARVKHNVIKSEKRLKKKHLMVQLSPTPGGISKKQEAIAKQREIGRSIRQQKRKNRNAVPQATYDLWGEVDINEPEAGVDDHYLTVTKKKRRKLPKKFLEKPSKVPAVEAPHPGMSYNPDYQDHQGLLAAAVVVEVKKEKVQSRIQRAIVDMVPKQTRESLEAARQKEMLEGLGQDQGSSSESEDESDDEISLNPAVRREDKKTEKQRKKEKELKEEERRRILEKEKVVKKKDVFRLKAIKAEVNERERMLAERALRKAEKAELNKNNPKKLGKLKFREPDLEIKLSDELAGSLRQLKPEGHLLADRYKSLQKRNIIEPRDRAKFQRKYKLKTYEKRDHRAVTL